MYCISVDAGRIPGEDVSRRKRANVTCSMCHSCPPKRKKTETIFLPCLPSERMALPQATIRISLNGALCETPFKTSDSACVLEILKHFHFVLGKLFNLTAPFQ